MKVKNWIVNHKIIAVIMLLVISVLVLFVYNVVNTGKTEVRVLEASERDCNFWERIFDLWPDEDECKIKEYNEAE